VLVSLMVVVVFGVGVAVRMRVLRSVRVGVLVGML
jgi:hypothetical protein